MLSSEPFSCIKVFVWGMWYSNSGMKTLDKDIVQVFDAQYIGEALEGEVLSLLVKVALGMELTLAERVRLMRACSTDRRAARVYRDLLVAKADEGLYKFLGLMKRVADALGELVDDEDSRVRLEAIDRYDKLINRVMQVVQVLGHPSIGSGHITVRSIADYVEQKLADVEQDNGQRTIEG